MIRQAVNSSSIRSLGYDVETQTLEVEFIQYGTFRYFDVPEFTYRSLLLAKSKGEYFNRSIADRFRFEEIRSEQEANN